MELCALGELTSLVLLSLWPSWWAEKVEAVYVANFYRAQTYLNVCLLVSLQRDPLLYKASGNNLIPTLFDLIIQNRHEQ